MIDFYKALLATARSAGLPIIGKYTAAKILFIEYAYGGSREEFSLSPKFKADMDYIQKEYGFEGGETPDTEVTAYIQQLYAENPTDVAGDKRTGDTPQWAEDFCKQRYGFSIIKHK
jgi:hypothetical protein